MDLKSTEIFIQLGASSIPANSISKYQLQKHVESVAERDKRKKNHAFNSAVRGEFIGGIAGALPAAALAIAGPAGIGLAIAAGGLAIGYAAGNKKGKKTFEEEKKNRTLDHSKLVLTLTNGNELAFCADSCGFNIYKKYDELKEKIATLNRIKEINEKIINGNDPGEEKVDYAIKWCLAELTTPVVAIKRDCESKYRYGCILLSEPKLIDEPQEYDHILVSEAGVVLIETKHWKGHIEICPDGKWLRKTDDDYVAGVESPVFQMRRHEMLMRKILPQVPIYSVLCFSNNSAVLDGQENFKEYPIVYVDQLKETLEKFLTSEKTSDFTVDYVVEEIEKHKVNKIEE